MDATHFSSDSGKLLHNDPPLCDVIGAPLDDDSGDSWHRRRRHLGGEVFKKMGGVPIFRELVTGKRHRAHCGNEAGEWDDLGIYYFKWTGESFAKQVIDYGPIGSGKGVGIHFALADLRGTGRLDLIAPGKEGLSVYYNEGLGVC